MSPPDPLRLYRLRVFDGNYEVLHRRQFVEQLDVDSPSTAALLYQKLATLTRQAVVLENQTMKNPRLEVWDVETNAKVRDVA